MFVPSKIINLVLLMSHKFIYTDLIHNQGTKIHYDIVPMINNKCKPHCCLFAVFPIEGSVFFFIPTWQIQTNFKNTLFPGVRYSARMSDLHARFKAYYCLS